VSRNPTEVFFHPDLFFSRPGCVGLIVKNRVKSVSFDVINSLATSTKLISNFNVFNNIKITLHYSVYMRTSGDKVRISDEAERVQSVSYSHIRSLSGFIQWCKARQAKHWPRVSLFRVTTQGISSFLVKKFIIRSYNFFRITS